MRVSTNYKRTDRHKMGVTKLILCGIWCKCILVSDKTEIRHFTAVVYTPIRALNRSYIHVTITTEK